MPMDSISMCSITFYVSNMDVGNSLRWLSASTMTKNHHFDSTSDHVPRLHIPAGILRIPVFSVLVAFFSHESRFLFCRNFF